MRSTLVIVVALLLMHNLTAQDEKPWQLVWSDEFDKDGRPDPANWTYEKGFVRNQEDQWYQKENAFCDNGYLIIEARREKKQNPLYQPGSNDWRERREHIAYTSSSLLTRGLHSWQYGRFEMRAKIDTSAGMWPAFWCLGINGWWPACGEIDMMEYYRGSILANVAWAGEGHQTKWDAVSKAVSSFEQTDWAEQFHIWRMDWNENEIRLYVDDYLMNTISLEKTVNKRSDIENPMKQPHYLLINLAIGGDNGGDPGETTFPRRYVVDYVRVYQ